MFKVAFDLVDKHQEDYQPQVIKDRIKTIHNLNENEVLDQETFLNRLPKAVINNGRVIDVRDGIANLMDRPKVK
jgi:hypothetical protein